MENKNEVLDEDFGEIQESEDTDWKTETFKLREKAIRQREKTKELRNASAEKDKKITDLEKELEGYRNPPKKDDKKPDEFGLLQKTYLRAAGITEEDEVELAKDIQKKSGLDWDKLVDDDYFKSKLENLRTEKANKAATSGVQGGTGAGQAKNTPEYWTAKGAIPKAEDVPDRKTRSKIIREMMKATKETGKFYNE